ncbi:MAG: hypothetical protein HYW01_06915 [Deltaproteobacteria bacterium]|nr:hypothetical protein [Deltaproteobacteria bacterium]
MKLKTDFTSQGYQPKAIEKLTKEIKYSANGLEFERQSELRDRIKALYKPELMCVWEVK